MAQNERTTLLDSSLLGSARDRYYADICLYHAMCLYSDLPPTSGGEPRAFASAAGGPLCTMLPRQAAAGAERCPLGLAVNCWSRVLRDLKPSVSLTGFGMIFENTRIVQEKQLLACPR